MDFETVSSTCESGPFGFASFQSLKESVWILGKQYVPDDLEDLIEDVRSRLWFTYRKNFPPIGGTGPTSDQGWGCMLRCGQMVMGQALMTRHLGRDWIWEYGSPESTYVNILKMFEDKKQSLYSIHQIAHMGESLGKKVGEWFGPNTVAHVLRKLAQYDEWSSIVVHVAMDNAVIVNEIKSLCKTPFKTEENEMTIPLRHRSACLTAEYHSQTDILNPSISPSSKLNWTPLLLFIPLRLGLYDINPIYFEGLKSSLRMKQSTGIIGGRPNHALYFIGYVGDELIFLDPHTSQPTVTFDEAGNDEDINDESFHCSFPGRMPISQLDPSIALCFYFVCEDDFDNWCTIMQKVLTDEKEYLFEIVLDRPNHLVPLNSDSILECPDFTAENRKFDTSDDEFEIL